MKTKTAKGRIVAAAFLMTAATAQIGWGQAVQSGLWGGSPKAYHCTMTDPKDPFKSFDVNLAAKKVKVAVEKGGKIEMIEKDITCWKESLAFRKDVTLHCEAGADKVYILKIEGAEPYAAMFVGIKEHPALCKSNPAGAPQGGGASGSGTQDYFLSPSGGMRRGLLPIQANPNQDFDGRRQGPSRL